ncbi:MAG: FliA/WhiG family RNA polymerase sigma factor [Actinomycetota bacterium]|nr:FliA/WhiG family RNA polymerase sigma factor [Actinomycetota bacterium]
MSGQTVGRLWKRYRKVREDLEKLGPDDERRREVERQAAGLRDRLVVNYSPLVKYVSSRVGARMTTGVIDQEDMISWGVLGLLAAIETYDSDRPGRKAKFESYAISKIRWTILDEIRSQDWVPRRVRLRAQEVEQATMKLTQELRRPPSEVEVAGELGAKVEDHQNFLQQYSRAQVASLEARLEVDGGPGGEYGAFIVDTSAVNPQSKANLEELRAHLVEAIGQLDEQEQTVATFYFYEGLTLKEIGKAMNLTEGRISQLLRRALEKLRGRLKESTLLTGGWQESLG